MTKARRAGLLDWLLIRLLLRAYRLRPGMSMRALPATHQHERIVSYHLFAKSA